MIRQRIRRRLTVSFSLSVLVLLGSYALLRASSGTSTAAPKTVIGAGPTLAPVSTGISQFPAPEESIHQRPISKSRKRKNPGIPKQPTAKLVATRASKSITNSYIDAANSKSSHHGLKDVSIAAEPIEPVS